jgi:hypothetical protein
MNQYQQWPLHQQIQVRQRIDELASGTLPPVNNPNITRQRGRPVGARNRQHNTSSTRRDPSGFELVERPARLCGRCRQPGHNIRSCPNPLPPTHTHTINRSSPSPPLRHTHTIDRFFSLPPTHTQ